MLGVRNGENISNAIAVDVLGGKRVLVAAITGSMGAGKDAVLKEIMNRHPEYGKPVTDTSRPIRVKDGEVDGVSYHFWSRQQFLERMAAGQYLETNEYRPDEWKGTSIEEMKRVLSEHDVVVWRIDPKTTVKAEEILQKAFGPGVEVVSIYVGAKSIRELADRAYGRDGDEGKEVFRRTIRADWADWKKYKDRYDLVVINEWGHLDETVEIVEREIERRKARLEIEKK